MGRRALVTGGTGQDGWYLIEFLLARDYEVHAQSRRAQPADQHRGAVRWHIGDISDPVVLQDLIAAVLPDEIYNLASVSRPLLSVANRGRNRQCECAGSAAYMRSRA